MSSSGGGYLIREMHNRGLRVKACPPNWIYEIVVVDSSAQAAKADLEQIVNELEDKPPLPRWESVAGTLQAAIEDMDWLFTWGVQGKLSGHDWLQCNSCDELKFLPKAEGAPSKKRKCTMTPRCTGIVRRLPEIFDVVKPKKKRAPKKPAVDQGERDAA